MRIIAEIWIEKLVAPLEAHDRASGARS
jgi:hypothetical protein